MTRRWIGPAVLVALFVASYAFGRFGAGVSCPFGADPLRPDQSVCTLAFGGAWVSLGVGALAAAFATLIGLLVAIFARLVGGAPERLVLGAADAFFSLPDVLVLMVLQFAGQALGDYHPALRLGPVPLMIGSLALIGWAAPARMLRNRLATLETQEFVVAAEALGASRAHVMRVHLWPFIADYVLALFLARLPAAILAESTVSFFGIARLEPMSLGRYLGTSYASLLDPGGARVVLPAWILLVAIVLAASLTARGLERSNPTANT
jgi:ABC-type dipeptide/oligopeptide/nickel transport system permease subunit